MKYYLLSIILSGLCFLLYIFLLTQISNYDFFADNPIGKIILILIPAVLCLFGGALIKKFVPAESSILAAVLFGATPAALTVLYGIVLLFFGWQHQESFFLVFGKLLLLLIPLGILSYLGTFFQF
ncbi:MAG TPA: hypothetical protein PLZ08_13345 [Bacillota bacterium]|jgi:hypothetical protein|nr:hypothetical protein [Bacillota bacterium]